jgi:hypothetical protein
MPRGVRGESVEEHLAMGRAAIGAGTRVLIQKPISMPLT